MDLIPQRWEGETVIGSDALPVDSIELVSLATNCADRFGLSELGAGDYLLRYRRIADWADLAVTGMRQTGTVTFRSSGTTGPAKAVSHRLDDLEQELQVLGGLIIDARRMVSLVPPHHIYGFLFTILLPMHLGIPVNHKGSASGMLPADLGHGDWLVGFPLRWRLMNRMRRSLPPGVAAVTSTAPCPAELIRALQGLGLQTMLAIYGSTETAGVGYRFDPDEPYRLFDYWRWDGQHLCRSRSSGDERTVEPEDELKFDDPVHFWPQGRKDAVVQVAGRNVHPADVADRLARHALVAECSVLLDDSGGEPRLSAAVVPVDGADAATVEPALRQWAQAQLSSAERPVQWSVVDTLPTTSTGKPRGWTASA